MNTLWKFQHQLKINRGFSVNQGITSPIQHLFYCISTSSFLKSDYPSVCFYLYPSTCDLKYSYHSWHFYIIKNYKNVNLISEIIWLRASMVSIIWLSLIALSHCALYYDFSDNNMNLYKYRHVSKKWALISRGILSQRQVSLTKFWFQTNQKKNSAKS